MANIFDYMDWRDLKLRSVEFNEIDNLILSRLAYFPLDNLINENEEITLYNAYQRYRTMKDTCRVLQKEDIDFFPKIAYSERFGQIRLTKYINKFEPEQEKQFSATTILLPDNTIYVSYRGTDNTIVGWKEDFNMSFNGLVPAQLDAVEYLENVALIYKDRCIRVGGHSKGGNLAVYASAFCKFEIKSRIINVYNNDGPGFHENVINTKEYKEILDRVHTYIPQTSIIGRLLNHEEETTILKSIQTGILQHDLYTWQVLGDHFVEDMLTNSSEFIDHTITDWLTQVSSNEREKFIDTLFDILNSTGAKTLSELSNKKFETAKVLLKTYKNIDEQSKSIIFKTLTTLFHIAKSNIRIAKPSIDINKFKIKKDNK